MDNAEWFAAIYYVYNEGDIHNLINRCHKRGIKLSYTQHPIHKVIINNSMMTSTCSPASRVQHTSKAIQFTVGVFPTSIVLINEGWIHKQDL